jgi:hypothetical protein
MKGDVIAIIAGVAAVFGLVASILGFISAYEARKATKLARESAAVVQTISVNVDGRLDGLFTRVAQLTDTLKAENITVPAPLPKVKS